MQSLVAMHFDDFIRAACAQRNLDWRKYRRASQRRVLERIRQLGLGGYQDYLRYLDQRPDEAGQLPNLLRVTLSRFFRERACWEELVGKALPELLARKTDPVLRVLNTPGLLMIGRKEALYLDGFFSFEQLSATGCLFGHRFNISITKNTIFDRNYSP